MLSKRILKSKKTACINFTVIAAIILVATLILEVNDSMFKIIYYMFPTALCFAYLIVLDGMFKERFNAWSTVFMIACTACIFYLNLLPLDVAHSHVYYKLIWYNIVDPSIIPNKPVIMLAYSAMIIVWIIQSNRLSKSIKEALW